MKRTLVIALLSVVVFAACIKNNTYTPPVQDCVNVSASSDEVTIKGYTNADTIEYARDTSLIYYHVFDSGIGAPAASTIFFNYKASLINGTVVSQSATVLSSPIVNLITGFQYMKRYYKKGARIKMVIPSILAYGCQGILNGSSYAVPPNAILIYEFTITDVQ